MGKERMMSSDNTRELFRELFMPRDATARTDILTPADIWGDADTGRIEQRLRRYAPFMADHLIDATEVVNDLLDCARHLISCNPPWVWLTDRLEVGSVVVTAWLGELRVGEVIWSAPCSARQGPDDDVVHATVVWWLSPEEALCAVGADLCVVDTFGHKVTG